MPALPDWREWPAMTPVTNVALGHHGRIVRLLLKLEYFNATGSVKDRTAAGLLAALHRERPLAPGSVVVESTSGNLGLALARLVTRLNCSFIAVIDPNTPREAREMMRSMGADVRLVEEPDGAGGYLLRRLHTVRQLCQENPDLRWTDQYHNPANPAVHKNTTGPEIIDQAGHEIDAIYIAVSTGGTLAGVSSFLKEIGLHVRIVAVDVEGSCVIDKHRSGRRIIPGIGSSQPSAFLHRETYSYADWVDTPTIVAMCRLFLQDTGVALGGSAGAVLAAVVADQAKGDGASSPLALCADSGGKYASTIYDDGWLERAGIARAVARRLELFRSEGVWFASSDGHCETPFSAPRIPHGTSDTTLQSLRRTMADLDATPGSQDRAAESAQQATRAEETICRIWAELLFADEVRTTDNFFDLGGDSFLAIRLSHRIQEELGIEVLLHELLASPTVAGQAAAISAAGCNGIKPRS